LHDPTVYPDPETFNPERYLKRTAEGGAWAVNLDAPNPRAAAFGFGRRVCPGVHLANRVLFAVIANVLAAFEIAPVRDEAGNEIRPAPRMTGAFIS
jgi:cytochrome P450